MTDKNSNPLRSESSGTGRRDLFACLLVAGLGCLLYVNTLDHGFALDDYHVILSNEYVQKGIAGLPSIWTRPHWYQGIQYRPVPASMFALEHALAGDDARLGHGVNVLLYALTCGILTAILLRLLGPGRRMTAIAAAVLFAAHPIHTEVVANIKSRDEILCFLALLGTIAAMTRWATKERAGAGRAVWLGVGLLVFALGLLTKESALTFVVAVPLVVYFFTDTTPRRIASVAAWMTGVAAAYVLFAVFVVGSLTGYTADNVLNNSLIAAHSRLDRLATAASILVRYIRLLVFPHPLVHDYGFNRIPVLAVSSGLGILSITACGGLLAHGCAGLRRKSISAFGILFAAITIALSSNVFILIGATMGERFLYIPALGFCLILADLLTKASRRWKTGRTWAVAVLVVLTCAYGIRTIARNADWKDNLTLFSRDITHAATSATANASLGNMLIISSRTVPREAAGVRDLESAVRYLRTAVAIHAPYAYAEGNLGLAFDFLELRDSALVHYLRAAQLDPGDAVSRKNAAYMYVNLKRYDSASGMLREIVQRNPADVESTVMLARVLALTDSLPASLRLYDEILRVCPSRADVAVERQRVARMDAARK